jgi:hypothetical protein
MTCVESQFSHHYWPLGVVALSRHLRSQNDDSPSDRFEGWFTYTSHQSQSCFNLSTTIHIDPPWVDSSITSATAKFKPAELTLDPDLHPKALWKASRFLSVPVARQYGGE